MTTDVDCAICGEPWEAWAIMQSMHDRGDMEKWEAVLFRKGAGCPCCKGESPDDATDADKTELVTRHVRQRVFRNAFDDDYDPTEAFEPPKWIEPRS